MRVLHAISISDRGYRGKSSHAPDRVVWLLRVVISTSRVVGAWPGRPMAIHVAFDTTGIRARVCQDCCCACCMLSLSAIVGIVPRVLMRLIVWCGC